MEMIIISSKEHLIRKAMALPISTSNKSPSGSETEGGREEFYTGLIYYQSSCTEGRFYWDILLNRNFQFQIFQVGGKTILVVGGNFSIYKDGQFFVLYLKLLKEFCNIFQVWIYVHC